MRRALRYAPPVDRIFSEVSGRQSIGKRRLSDGRVSLRALARLPRVAKLAVVALIAVGLALLFGAWFLGDAEFGSSVLIELGSAFLLFVPLLVLEIHILNSQDALRMDQDALRRDTAQIAERVEETLERAKHLYFTDLSDSSYLSLGPDALDLLEAFGRIEAQSESVRERLRAGYREIAQNESRPVNVRVKAATKLANLGMHDEASELLGLLGEDSKLPVIGRVDAAKVLAALETGAPSKNASREDQAVRVLRGVVAAQNVGWSDRVYAAVALGSIRADEARRSLGELARTSPEPTRALDAMRTLGLGADLLAAAQDDDFDPSTRCHATLEWASLDRSNEAQASEILQEILSDPNLDDSTRIVVEIGLLLLETPRPQG